MADDNQQQQTDSLGAVDKVRQLEERILELENNWKRALADYKNLEKRNGEERSSLLEFSNSILILRILPILDNLELLDEHLSDAGLKMILKEFKQILRDDDVTEIVVHGKEFDPNSMEAVETAEGEPNKVVAVLSKGYLMKGKLLRPARVRVGKKEEK